MNTNLQTISNVALQAALHDSRVELDMAESSREAAECLLSTAVLAGDSYLELHHRHVLEDMDADYPRLHNQYIQFSKETRRRAAQLR